MSNKPCPQFILEGTRLTIQTEPAFTLRLMADSTLPKLGLLHRIVKTSPRQAGCRLAEANRWIVYEGLELMTTPPLPQRIPQGAFVGARAAFTRTLTEADAALFIGVTWDINPLHTDESYARATRFKRRILPGLLTASLLTHLGGLWAFMATEMRFEFLAPVYPVRPSLQLQKLSKPTRVATGCACVAHAPTRTAWKCCVEM